MRLLVTSPVKSHHVLLAKALAAGLGALIQLGLLTLMLGFLEVLGIALELLQWDLSLVFPWVGQTSWPNLALLIPFLVIAAFSCGTLGVLCGVFAKSIDGFAVMMNFVIFPLFFFSGALYPLAPMPAVAKAVALANPFSYTVDLLRHAFASHAEMSIHTSLSFLGASSIVMLIVATWRFRKSGAAVPLQV